MEKYIFYILAFIIIVFAIASVTSRKMLRSVIYLLFVLSGIAGLYFLIDYKFFGGYPINCLCWWNYSTHHIFSDF